MTIAAVGFVIPHKGREELLRQTLASIARQESTTTFDVTVVTQNAHLAEETRDAVDAVGARVIHADTALTISALRNLGANRSDSRYLAFLDADIALSTNWLREMLNLLKEDSTIALASAVQVAERDAKPLERIRVALSNRSVDAAVPFLPGRNLLLERRVFEEAGRFPEHLVTCEDYYFTDRVASIGTLWYSSRANYVHLGEDRRLGEMFRKEIWRGQSNLQSLQGRRVAPGEWPSFVVPLWITLASLLAGLLMLAGKSPGALFAAAAAALPLGAYVMRLYFLAEKRIPLGHIVAFYGCYFPARALGTILGLTRSVGRNLHNR